MTIKYDGWSHGYPYIVGTAVNDHVAAYMAEGGANWGTIGNDDHWAPGHNGDHTSKPGDPTRPQPYITANDSWSGGNYDHDDYAFNFLLPRLKAGFYKNQIKFFNCSKQQWSANNGWKVKQADSSDIHLHISFYGTGMFHFYGTSEYFLWKADGRPDVRTWSPTATTEDHRMDAIIIDGKLTFFTIGSDGFVYFTNDPTGAKGSWKLVSNKAKFMPGINVSTYPNKPGGVMGYGRSGTHEPVMIHMPNFTTSPADGFASHGLGGTASGTPAGIVTPDGTINLMIRSTYTTGPKVGVILHDQIKVNGTRNGWHETAGRAL